MITLIKKADLNIEKLAQKKKELEEYSSFSQEKLTQKTHHKIIAHKNRLSQTKMQLDQAIEDQNRNLDETIEECKKLTESIKDLKKQIAQK